MFPFPLPLLSFPSHLGFLSFPLFLTQLQRIWQPRRFLQVAFPSSRTNSLQYWTIWSRKPAAFLLSHLIPTHPPSLTSSHSVSLLCIFLCDLNPAATQTCPSLSGTHPVLINKTKNNRSYIRPHLQKALMPPTQGLSGTVRVRYMWAPEVRSLSTTGS